MLCKRGLCVLVHSLCRLCASGHHIRYSTALWAFHIRLFSVHLRGSAQDFVEILMDLWPRFGVGVNMCVWMCLMYVSLTTPSRRNILMGGGELSRNVVLSRISFTWISCLYETVFTPNRKKWNQRKKPCWWTCMYIIIFHSFMHLWKNHPWGFGSTAKAALSEEAKGWKVRQTEAEKWRTNHWQSCHGLVYALTG